MGPVSLETRRVAQMGSTAPGSELEVECAEQEGSESKCCFGLVSFRVLSDPFSLATMAYDSDGIFELRRTA